MSNTIRGNFDPALQSAVKRNIEDAVAMAVRPKDEFIGIIGRALFETLMLTTEKKIIIRMGEQQAGRLAIKLFQTSAEFEALPPEAAVPDEPTQ